MTTGRRSILLAAGAFLLLVPFVVPVPDDLERIRSLRLLGVLAHIGLPAVLTVFLYHVGPVRGRLVTAAACALALAAGCELLQTFVQRHPRWEDVGVDLIGVSIAAGWLGWRGGRGRGYALIFAAGLLAMLSQTYKIPGFILAERQAVQRFPLIADFETALEFSLWGSNEGGHGRYGRRKLDDGGYGIVVNAESDYLYPGVIVRGVPRDWSAFKRLEFRARLDHGSGVRINLRLDDFASREDSVWCGEGFGLEQDWQTFEVDLEGLAAGVTERPFRLDDIDSVLLYLTRVEDGTSVLIDDIVLR